jgi:hypothetical protein
MPLRQSWIVFGLAAQLVLSWTTPIAAVVQAKQGAPAVIAYATTAFDLSVETLPSNYRGMDCVRVVTALKRLALKKEKYETTAAYDERLISLGKSVLYGSIRAGDVLAFRAEGPVKTEYDADKAVLTMKGPRVETAFAGENIEMFQARRVVVLNASQSSYVGSNAFGTQARVQKTRVATCGVLEKDADNPASFGMPAEVPEAKAMESALGMLVIGTIAPPYAADGALSHHEATISEPIESTTTITGIGFKRSQIWYYNTRTGKVYARLN